jgi:superfamily II DNA or RNA helicase
MQRHIYFYRESGFSSAYVGSSNLSNPAITSGLEWNVKLTEKDAGDILQKICMSFESYWDNPEFVPYKENDRLILQEALSRQKGKTEDNDLPVLFDIVPYFYQKEILEKLLVEREVYGRYHNLVVAATGTGKTIISAFDYRNYVRSKNPQARLLFVAHREEILKQSLSRFRMIMRDPNFGDLCIRGVIPQNINHCFISIQTFNSTKFHTLTSPDFYDYIIVDEFHHAAAASYQTLLQYYHPKNSSSD